MEANPADWASSRFERGQLELCALAMLGADFHERMKRAGRDVQPQPLTEELGDFPVCPPLPAQLPDQFAVRFEF